MSARGAKRIQSRNPLGWGYIEERLDTEEQQRVHRALQQMLDVSRLEWRDAPALASIELKPTRFPSLPAGDDLWTNDVHSRLLHALGRSTHDLLALRGGRPLPAPDLVASPRNSDDLLRVLEFADRGGFAVIPFGGGSSVVGGVNPEGMDDRPAVISVDLQRMNAVHTVSAEERVVHAEAGILGPDLDAALRPHSLHVRHTPQSYHHSTLGGWLATRGAGHNSTVHTNIEDRVQSVAGYLIDGRSFETRPLPATSVAIDPRSYWCGSEGMLGFITAVRLRVYPLPTHRGFRAIRFDRFEQALEAARRIAQSDLFPVQLRILDPAEGAQTAALAGFAPIPGALMIIGDESTLPVVESRLEWLSAIAVEAGGRKQDAEGRMIREWIRFFFRMPYMRDHLLDAGLIVDTFETSIPWRQATSLYNDAGAATARSIEAACGAAGRVSCRVTHAYPDGVCLYFSFFAPGRHGALLEQWKQIKQAASDAVIAGGGTISHHHAMGRDHRDHARIEFPAIHRAAIRALKAELDPKGLMNPGLWFHD